jgi:hypothetical protein
VTLIIGGAFVERGEGRRGDAHPSVRIYISNLSVTMVPEREREKMEVGVF